MNFIPAQSNDRHEKLQKWRITILQMRNKQKDMEKYFSNFSCINFIVATRLKISAFHKERVKRENREKKNKYPKQLKKMESGFKRYS